MSGTACFSREKSLTMRARFVSRAVFKVTIVSGEDEDVEVYVIWRETRGKTRLA